MLTLEIIQPHKIKKRNCFTLKSEGFYTSGFIYPFFLKILIVDIFFSNSYSGVDICTMEYK